MATISDSDGVVLVPISKSAAKTMHTQAHTHTFIPERIDVLIRTTFEHIFYMAIYQIKNTR